MTEVVLLTVLFFFFFVFFLMLRRPPRSTQSRSSAASDVYKRQPMLFIGERLGSGDIEIDIAVDPLENTNATADLKPGAVCVLAASSRGCLLYTSPSPRDRTRSRMPSSA